jgi:hypothetical protein
MDLISADGEHRRRDPAADGVVVAVAFGRSHGHGQQQLASTIGNAISSSRPHRKQIRQGSVIASTSWSRGTSKACESGRRNETEAPASFISLLCVCVCALCLRGDRPASFIIHVHRLRVDVVGFRSSGRERAARTHDDRGRLPAWTGIR